MTLQEPLRFDGPCYDPKFDLSRLSGQIRRIFDLMSDGQWRTLSDISSIIEAPEASISGNLRHLRKERFGGHTVNKRRKGDPHSGLWEYQLIIRLDL